jgi:hypothetical protein
MGTPLATSPMTPESPKWVFWSTRETIDNDVPSVTAILETVIAVAAYWWIAIHFGTYLLLVVSVVVAPLVLLRTKESVLLGAKRLDTFVTRGHLFPTTREMFGRAERLIAGIATVIIALIACAAFLFVSFTPGIGIAAKLATIWCGSIVATLTMGQLWHWSSATIATSAAIMWIIARASAGLPGTLVDTTTLASAILGVAMATLFIRTIQTYEVTEDLSLLGLISLLLGPLAVIGIAFRMLILALVIRFVATITYVRRGMRMLPRNFLRLILCTSPLQEPELVPGLTSNHILNFGALMRKIRTELASGQATLLVFTISVAIPMAAIWFAPSWLYRLTLKSTTWFWWPLAFLGGDLQRAKHPEPFRTKMLGTLWAKTNIVLAIGTIVAFVTTNFIFSGSFLKSNPLLTIVGYFLVIDYSSLRPWQLLSIGLATLSLIIAFWIDDVAADFMYATRKADQGLLRSAERKLGWIERLGRFRLLLAILFWLIVGGQTLLYFNSVKCWFTVPANVESWAQWVYGDRLPQAHCGTEHPTETSADALWRSPQNP